MVDNNTKVWLSFSITPVQRFIEAARTVRDLKTGSEILCWLTDSAITAGKVGGGELLFPWIDDKNTSEKGYVQYIPNQFIMLFDTVDAAKEAEAACRKAVTDAWLHLATGVHDLLHPLWSRLCNWNPCGQWDTQVSSFWDLHTAVLPPTDDILYGRLFGGAAETDPWRRQWKVAAAVLAMNKQVRHFPGDQGIGRAKCSMMGDFEQMGPGGQLSDQDKFWKNRRVAAFSRSGIRIGKRDRLCAVALVKRFAPAVRGPLSWLQAKIPDTAMFATQCWCRLASENMGPIYDAWEHAAAAYCEVMGESADQPGRYLLDEDLHAPKPEECPEDQSAETCIIHFKSMKEAREALHRAVGERDKNQAVERKMGQPPRYFAVLALDGDHMGSWLGGDSEFVGKNTLLGKNHYHEMSRALRHYGEKTAAKLIHKHDGHLVYAGGDDLLAFLPVRTALPCTLDLLNAYPNFSYERKPTASVGIAICHYLHDLRSALRQARVALEDAKDNGRNRIGWRLLKRAGGDLQGILERDLAVQVQEMAKRFEAGISDRWVYRLAETSAQLHDRASIEAAGLLCRHALKRVEGSKTDKQELEEAVEALWEKTTDNLHKRNEVWNKHIQDPNQKRGRKFTLECLQAFIDALLLAIFIIRGRD